MLSREYYSSSNNLLRKLSFTSLFNEACDYSLYYLRTIGKFNEYDGFQSVVIVLLRNRYDKAKI